MDGSTYSALPNSELTTSGFLSPFGFRKLILKPVPIMRPICVFGCSDNPVNKHATFMDGNFLQQSPFDSKCCHPIPESLTIYRTVSFVRPTSFSDCWSNSEIFLP